MADDVMVAPEGGAGLSQVMRVVDTFVAPRKTFTDILRSTNWLLPFILMVIVGIASTYAIDRKVGFVAVTETQISHSEMASNQMSSLTPDQRASAIQKRAIGTKYVSYCFFLLLLLIVAVEALVLWASFNFGLGAKTTFGQVFAVIMFSSLPRLFVGILNIILLFANVGIENYNIENPVGTNLGYYLTSPALSAAGRFFDIFSLWSLFLLIIGMSIIAKKSLGQAAVIILGWWVLILLVSTGIAAVFG